MATEQIGMRTPDGMIIGGSATDKIGFFGSTSPVVQQTNASTMVASTATTTSIATEVNKLSLALKNLGLSA